MRTEIEILTQKSDENEVAVAEDYTWLVTFHEDWGPLVSDNMTLEARDRVIRVLREAICKLEKVTLEKES